MTPPTTLPGRDLDSAELAAKVREHLDYLQRISEGSDAVISRQTARNGQQIWDETLAVTDGRIPVPAAFALPDGQLCYVWDEGHHHLELTITTDATAEWYYSDGTYQNCWMETGSVSDLPEAVRLVLAKFVPV